jgi:hypothetical protein
MLRPYLMACLLALPTMAFAQDPVTDQPMRFSMIKACHAQDCTPAILAQGDINSDTPAAFEAFHAASPSPKALYFDSAGGNVTASMRLGLAIRRARLATIIGGGQTPGHCFSACAYAFMGGAARHLEPGALLGVHRFYAPPGHTENVNSDDSQKLVALLTNYTETMGISPAIMALVASAGSDSLSQISPEQAVALNLDNTRPPLMPWALLPNEADGIDLVANQQAQAADHLAKIVIGQRANRGMLVIRYQEPYGRSEAEVLASLKATSFAGLCRSAPTSPKLDTKRCIYATPAVAWKALGNRQYGAGFEVSMTQLSTLAQGEQGDVLLLAVGSLTASAPAFFLRLSTQGFATGLRAIQAIESK